MVGGKGGRHARPTRGDAVPVPSCGHRVPGGRGETILCSERWYTTVTHDDGGGAAINGAPNINLNDNKFEPEKKSKCAAKYDRFLFDLE